MPCAYCRELFLPSNADGSQQCSLHIRGADGWQSLCLAAASCRECSLIENVVRAGAPEGELDVRSIWPRNSGELLGLAVAYGSSNEALFAGGDAAIIQVIFPFMGKRERQGNEPYSFMS